MNIILNEVEEAKKRIQENELGDKPTETIGLMARYYRQIEKLSERETIDRIEQFMQKNCEMYNPVKWKATILKHVKGAKKYNMVQVNSVGITQQELDIISAVSERRLRKLLFALICLAKFFNKRGNNTNDWVSTEYKDIFRMAHIFVTQSVQTKMLSELYNLGMISFGNKITNLNIHLNVIDHENEPVWIIDDFRDLGNEYVFRTETSDLFRCESCGLVIKKNRNVHKYCPQCADKIQRYQIQQWKLNNRR